MNDDLDIPPVEDWLDDEEYAAWVQDQELYAGEQEWPEDFDITPLE